MANTDVMVLTDEQIAALAASMGTSSDDLQGGGGSFLPALKIWMDEDEDDGPRLKGKLYVTDQEETVFADKGTVVFRPLTHAYQWTQWDKDQGKTVNRSRLVFNFREEARDEKGTVKCGKPPSKELKDNPALAKRYEDITTWRRVQGYVSYKGTTKEGKAVEVKNLLVGLNLKGANFTPFDTEFVQKMPDKSALWDFSTKIDLSREKNGSVTYYVMHFEPDFTNKIRMDLDTFNVINGLKETIDSINKEIDQKYYEALQSRQTDSLASAALKDVTPPPGRPGANRGLTADFDDDIPF